jgi:hypothetical protein
MAPIEKPPSSSGQGVSSKPDPFKKPSFLERPDFMPKQKTTPQSSQPTKPGLFSWLKPFTASATKKAPATGSPGSSSAKAGGSLFSQKKDWRREDFLRQTAKAPFSFRGKSPSNLYNRKKMINEALPDKRFSTYISESEVKKRLRELRRDEYKAQSGEEKSRLKGTRKYLEKQTGLEGKY